MQRALSPRRADRVSSTSSRAHTRATHACVTARPGLSPRSAARTQRPACGGARGVLRHAWRLPLTSRGVPPCGPTHGALQVIRAPVRCPRAEDGGEAIRRPGCARPPLPPRRHRTAAPAGEAGVDAARLLATGQGAVNLLVLLIQARPALL